MSIPKIIHYCWLSGSEYPELVQQCIASWHSVLPDYEFVLWDMDRIKEINSIWVSSAIESKKWAFAADYIRLYALQKYGGIYLDCDVLVKKTFNDLLDRVYFICRERRNDVLEAAVIGSQPNVEWITLCLNFYQDKLFDVSQMNRNHFLIPFVIRNSLVRHGYLLKESEDKPLLGKKVFSYFPYYYFSPKDNLSGNVHQTDKTYCIHMFDGAWTSSYQKKYTEILERYSRNHSYTFGKIVATLFSAKERFFPKYSKD